MRPPSRTLSVVVVVRVTPSRLSCAAAGAVKPISAVAKPAAINRDFMWNPFGPESDLDR
jgi:hypothetical protein